MSVSIIGCPTKFFTFPSGERHVQLLGALPMQDCLVRMDFKSSDDIMDWLLVDSVCKQHKIRYMLSAPYLPFSRQDRYTDAHSPFSLDVMASLLDNSNAHSLLTADLHSDVLLKYPFKDLQVMNIPMCFAMNADDLKEVGSLVVPDKGALRKVEACAIKLNVPISFIGVKNRDVKTGQITSMTVSSVAFAPPKPILVMDDICDGGATFISLAKEIKAHELYNDQELWLYVTHGIFSKGKQTLLDAGYSKIICLHDGTKPHAY